MSTVLGRIARWILNHKLFSSHSKSDKTKEVSELDYSDQIKSDWNQQFTQTEDESEWTEEEDGWYDDNRKKALGPDGPITYRVIKEFTNEFASEENRYTEKVLWQGKNVDELSRSYPPSDVSDADSLAYAELEEGYIRWHYRFESQMEDGTWQKCEDPRNRDFVTDEFLDREREIDLENRRRFPGDYYVEDDNDEDYPYMDDDFPDECDERYDDEE